MILWNRLFQIFQCQRFDLTVDSHAEVEFKDRSAGSTFVYRDVAGIDIKFPGLENSVLEVGTKSIVASVTGPETEQIALGIALLLRVVSHIDVGLVPNIVYLKFVSLCPTVTFEGKPAIGIVGGGQIDAAPVRRLCSDKGDTRE